MASVIRIIMMQYCACELPVVECVFLATLTFALPYTKYEVRLVACTRGGCTEGNGTPVETDPDGEGYEY